MDSGRHARKPRLNVRRPFVLLRQRLVEHKQRVSKRASDHFSPLKALLLLLFPRHSQARYDILCCLHSLAL